MMDTKTLGLFLIGLAGLLFATEVVDFRTPVI